MINKKPAKNLNNVLYYQADRNNDLTNYIDTSVFEWINMATNRNYPLIIKFCIFKENNGLMSFEFPVFPATIQRTNDSILKYLNGKKTTEIPREGLNESKTSYRKDILNYIKNEIAATYATALMKNDEQTKDLLSLKMMKDFDYGAYLGGLYSDEVILPDKDLEYQDNYVAYICFKQQMEPLTNSAQEYYNKFANKPQRGE